MISLSNAAYAQSVGDVAVREADNAFGVTIEGASLGLYNIKNARGASPIETGNVRVDGLFAFVGSLGRLSDSAQVALGPSALSTFHAAPSGVVEQSLRRVRQPFISTSVSLNDRLSSEISADFGYSGGGQISYYGGGGVARTDPGGTVDDDWFFDVAGAAFADFETSRWAAFGSFTSEQGSELDRLFVTADGLPPPKLADRRQSYAQPYAQGNFRTALAGVIGHIALGESLALKVGGFLDSYHDGAYFKERIDLDAMSGNREGIRVLSRFDPGGATTLSGEVRLEQSVTANGLRGLLFASARFRRERARFGGTDEQTLDTSLVSFQTRSLAPQPTFVSGPDFREDVDQALFGAGAHLAWQDRVALNVGLQRSRYKRETEESGAGAVRSVSSRWIGNALGKIRLASNLFIYAGFATGIEELAAPPINAINANAALAAALSRQKEGGVSVRVGDQLDVVIGVFELTRPFADLDASNVFRVAGQQKDRGVEASFVWRPTGTVNFLSGWILQDSKVVDDQLGQSFVTPGIPEIRGFASIDYGISFLDGLFVNAAFRYERGVPTMLDGGVTLPDRTEIDIFLRYEFTANGVPAQIELGVENATDEFAWFPDGRGGFTSDGGRFFSASLVADF